MVGLLRFVLRPCGHWRVFTDDSIMMRWPVGRNQTKARHRVRSFLHFAARGGRRARLVTSKSRDVELR